LTERLLSQSGSAQSEAHSVAMRPLQSLHLIGITIDISHMRMQMQHDRGASVKTPPLHRNGQLQYAKSTSNVATHATAKIKQTKQEVRFKQQQLV
jgi:hypothetical protein